MKKRLVALIMVMALALSLVPVGAVDLDFQNQIDSNGNEITTDDQKVKHSKTITQTGENTFDITLTVKTVEEIEKQTVSEDAAVVLVLDMSNSMTEEDMQAAREAAKNFVNQLVEGASSTAQRQVAIVEFGSNAKTAVPWANANDSSQKAQILSGIDSVENGFSYDVYCSETGKHTHEERVWVDNAEVEQGFLGRWYCTTCGKAFKNPARTGHWCTQNVECEGSHVTKTERDGGGTNIEGGLLLANNLLGASSVSGISNKYVVLMTDGVPTYHVDDSDETGNTSFIEGSRGGGDEADHEDYHDISCVSGWDTGDNLPQQIKNQGAKLYTVSYKNSNQTVAGKTIDKWLASFSTQTITAEDDIFGSLEKIAEIIVNQAKAWILTDPMGDYINFGENPSITRVTNANEADSDAVRKFNTDTKTLIWDLKNDVTPSKEGDWNVYTLNYSITLDNLVENFQAKKPYSTNGKTELTYMVTKDGVLQPDLETTELQVPTVHGLASDLTFTKKGSDDKTLENVTFTLTTEDKDGWFMTATSGEDGTVSFTNIPSGHTYTLTETSTPEGYIAADPITVTVSNGTVTTTASETGGSNIEDNVLINQAQTGILTVTKKVNGLEGSDTLPADFKIEVKNSDTVVKTLTTSNADSGTTYTWTVNDLAPGTYTVTESNYDVEGYSVETTGNNDTVKVTAGQPATADLTNTYTANTYGLTVEKTVTGMSGETVDGKKMAKPNDTLTYTITVTNTGNTERNKVTVTDTFMVGDAAGKLTIPEGNGYAVQENDDGTYTITIDSLAAADSTENGGEDTITITATYKVTADDAGKTITNTAVAFDGDSNPDNDPTDETITTVENPDWTVTKTVDNATPNVGDTITYTIHVTNTGNTTLNGLTVTDTMDGDRTVTWVTPLPPNVTDDDGDGILTVSGLAPNKDVVITATYKVVATDAGATFKNTVTVSDGTTSETPDEPPEVTVSNPNVSINKTVSGMSGADNRAVEGDALTYTISVKNSGNTKLDVAVSDDMWTAGKVNSAELDGTTIDVSSGSYTISGLDVGESKSITYTYTVTAEDVTNGTIDNAATADINEDGTPDAKHEITTPTGEPSLIVDKTASEETVQVGAPITYTIEVKNDGYSVINNVVVRDTLWTEDTELTATGDVTGTYQVDEDGGKYYISEMKPGETLTITYTYTPTEAGTLTNKVEVTADNLPDGEKPSDEVTVEVTPEPVSSLTVNKSLAQVNGSDYTGGKVSVGDKLTYTIQVTNTGNTTLSGVTVEDSLWNYEDAIQVDGELAYVADGGTYTIKYEIAPDDMVTITYTYIVLRSDAGDTLTNTATVTTPDGGTTGEDTTETPVKPVPPIRPPVDPDKPELNTEDHYAYIVGYEDGSVQPEGDITRAEVATIFFRLLTDESRNEFWSQTNPYSDVSEDDWYNNAVSTLTNAGIIDGYEDGTFKPNGNITRAEFATIAVRFFQATYEGENLFPDIDGHWAQDYINEAANAGIVDGYPDGTFRPQQYITRAEAMTMVNRTIDRHPDADHLLADMIVWPDNPETAWYYEQVQEATNSHAYTMNTDDEQNPYEIWTELLPNRDWSELEKEWSDANDGAGSGEVV